MLAERGIHKTYVKMDESNLEGMGGGILNVGFLIGESTSVRTQIVSDAEMEEERIEKTITVNGSLAVGLPYIFCSPLGKIKDGILKEVLGNLAKDVVGWYSFRRNCSHNITLLQNRLHRELRLINNNKIHPCMFVFCQITKTESEDSATHSFKITYSTMNDRRFFPVNFNLTNLGEPEENTYKKALVNNNSKHLQQVVHSLNGEKNCMGAIMKLHLELNKHIGALQSKVYQLQTEVNTQQTRTRRNSSKSLSNDRRADRAASSSPPPSTSTSHQVELSAEY